MHIVQALPTVATQFWASAAMLITLKPFWPFCWISFSVPVWDLIVGRKGMWQDFTALVETFTPSCYTRSLPSGDIARWVNKTILSRLYFRPHFPGKNPIVPIYKPANMFDSEEMCQTDMQFTF